MVNSLLLFSDFNQWYNSPTNENKWFINEDNIFSIIMFTIFLLYEFIDFISRYNTETQKIIPRLIGHMYYPYIIERDPWFIIFTRISIPISLYILFIDFITCYNEPTNENKCFINGINTNMVKMLTICVLNELTCFLNQYTTKYNQGIYVVDRFMKPKKEEICVKVMNQ
jgi:hypothetical protein